MTPFGVRLREAMDSRGPLCVGIDPHASLLSAWGLTDDVAGLEFFARTCVEALAGTVAVLKPQSAFFERFGSRGIAVLESVIADSRSGGALVLVDAKRGDIGSTMQAYAEAYLGSSSPLAGDAVTVSPYLGYGSLRPAIDLAREQGRGVFVLALTSNPDGAQVQHARTVSGAAVAAVVVAAATQDNANELAGLQVADQARIGPVDDPHGALGSVGLVVGATVGSAVTDLGIDLAASRAPLLAPGVGAQGAGVAELQQVFGAARANVLASTSRAVLRGGPTVQGLRDACARARDEVGRALG